ncbi:MAG: ABC transporter permease [Candidatus Dormiibacterota bacterium]
MTTTNSGPPGVIPEQGESRAGGPALDDEGQTAAAAQEADLAIAPELVATSISGYMRAWWVRVRGGDTGVLPIVIGLAAIVLIFQSQNQLFLSSGNITNLLVQGTVFVLFGLAEVFVLLLGEIDLSVGYVAGFGAVVVALLVGPVGLPWYLAILAGMATTTAIGILHGTLITRLHLPSFVVTLAGLLFWEGAMIQLVNITSPTSGGVISVSNNPVIFNLVNGNMTAIEGWITLVVVMVIYVALTLRREARRRSRGLAAPPMRLTLLRMAMVAVAGVLLVLIFNSPRGTAASPFSGIPPVIPAILVILVAASFLLSSTRFGRYVYAIGGNAEAARRAGVNLTWIRTAAFGLSGLVAGLAGIVYESRLGSIATDIDGGTYVLYAVAAAVIGGASLFGGRGKPVHALLGGVVIAAIYNGMGLLNMSAAVQYMVTGLVLLAALTVDRVARRGRAFRSADG